MSRNCWSSSSQSPWDQSHRSCPVGGHRSSVNFFDAVCPWTNSLSELEWAMRDMNREFRNMDQMVNSIYRDIGIPRSNLHNQVDLKPEVVSEGDQKKYRLHINMGPSFSPEDLKISVKDGVMSIEAKHEKKSEDGNHRVYQEVTRKFTLPKDVDPKEVKSVLSPQGVLQIEAPLPQKAIEAQQPKPIPIKHE